MKIAWTKLAISDLNHAFDHIHESNPELATIIFERFDHALLALTEYPHIGRNGRVNGTRELIVSGTPFILPYRVKDQKLEILAVIHSSRKWPNTI